MPKKFTQPTRDGPRCQFGHDWRVSFDGRFYYCYNCPAEWFSQDGRDGGTPPQESYKSYPDYHHPTWAGNPPEGDSTTMPSKEFDALLDDDDTATSDMKESWMKVRDMLYEPIRVNRANVREEEDSYNPGKTRTVAYVHFHFLDDLSLTPFVFSSSAKAIVNTVNRAVEGNEFPFETAVIEILSAEPFNGYFPLRFTSLGKLPAAKAAMEASNGLMDEPEPTTPPETPPAPAVSASSRATAPAAATAGKRSAGSGPRPVPANLRNRGN